MASISSPSRSQPPPPKSPTRGHKHPLRTQLPPGPASKDQAPFLKTHLSTPKHNFELLASRTLSQAAPEDARRVKPAASPLDSIDPSLYPRFPRFSVTTDNSLPDLSTEEVTSTRISLDEEAIVGTADAASFSQERTSRRKRLQTKLHHAVSSPSLDMKRVGDRIKRVPTILRSPRTPSFLRRSISDSQAEVMPALIPRSASTY